jgi:hypothetical protein
MCIGQPLPTDLLASQPAVGQPLATLANDHLQVCLIDLCIISPEDSPSNETSSVAEFC